MVDPFWGEEHQDGGPPSWWIHFGVKNIKMEAYHHGGSVFGVKNIKMEAHHHGGSILE